MPLFAAIKSYRVEAVPTDGGDSLVATADAAGDGSQVGPRP